MKLDRKSSVSRPGRSLLLALGVVAGAALMANAASSTDRPSPASLSSVSMAVPLASSVTTSFSTWAIVLMGKSDGDHDLFWQLFTWRSTTKRWGLVTPPGVADNGGLVIAPRSTGTSALVGFGASQGLTFSPLALSEDSGATWSPGGLPQALAPSPSAIAMGPSGNVLALVGADGEVVDGRIGDLTSWRPLVNQRDLEGTSGGEVCAIGSIQAVAFSAIGNPMVGGSCRRVGHPGVFVESGTHWQLADVPVPHSLSGASFSVLRMGSASALLSAAEGTSTQLVAAWLPSGNQPWMLSSALVLGSSDHLVASGAGPGDAQFVVLRSGGFLDAEISSGPGSRWRALPRLPMGTATIAFEPDGGLDALTVADTNFTAWRLGTTSRTWTKVQSMTVPIVFGSSS